MFLRNQLHQIRGDKLLWITAGCLAAVAFCGPIQLSDIQWNPIGTLLSLMTIVQLYQRMNVLESGSRRLGQLVHSQRAFVRLMAFLAFGAAMLMTNDVAIISILPLYLLSAQRYHLAVALPATLIAVAANMGSALTPFGNPQNLFLFSHYQIPVGRFLAITGPLTVASAVCIWLLAGLVPNRPLNIPERTQAPLDRFRLGLTMVLSVVVLSGVLGLLPLWLVVAVAIGGALLLDRGAFAGVDYGLLLTFMGFFMITGTLSRITVVHATLHALMITPTSVYAAGVVVSQFISNVPAAVLLAQFTGHGYALLLGVNVGGLGTLIASLANLLAFKTVARLTPDATGAFFKQFTLVNLLLLIVIGIVGLIILLI